MDAQDDVTIAGEISKGTFGVVYKAVRKADQRVFALKQVKLAGMKRRDREEAIDEARMLAGLNHPHVIKHLSSFIDKEDKLNIIMEYASGGNVALKIKAEKGRGLPEDDVWKILIQSLLGLNQIHKQKIIHRDIKALNLFLDAHGNIKIGDLGIARALGDGSNFARTIVGTPYYLSPELCDDKPYNEKSDIWALGVVMYECCMGKYPFDAQNEGALIRKILAGRYPPISGPYSTELIKVLQSLMIIKPDDRPDTYRLLRHPAVVAKAKTLKLNLNPTPQNVVEDQPVYERPTAYNQQPPLPYAYQQQQPTPYGMPQQQPYGAPGMPQYPGQQYPLAYAQGHLPPQYANALPQPQSSAMMPQAGYPPANHWQQQQQYDHQHGMQRASGPHPFDLPPQMLQPPAVNPVPAVQNWQAPLPGQLQQQQQQQHLGHPAYQNQGFSGKGSGANDYDKMADEIERMQLGTPEYNRRHGIKQGQQQQQPPQLRPAQLNVPAAKRDHVKGVLAHPQADTPNNGRLRPEELPAAGCRGGSGRQGAPFALHCGGDGVSTQSQLQGSAVWGATYQSPQYGRKRCPELQITGPSLRSGPGLRPGSARAGGYAPAADDATTYVSSSYATYYK